jgi:hypothetical protein
MSAPYVVLVALMIADVVGGRGVSSGGSCGGGWDVG